MINLAFAETLEKYFSHFKNEQYLTGKSDNTVISYNTTITSFIKFVKEYEKPLDFKNLKKIDIMNYLTYKNENLQKQSELKNSSKLLYVTHLKTFFTYIQENMDEEIKISTVFKININVPKRSPKGIVEDDVEKLKKYIASLGQDSFLHVRASLLLKVYLYTGARRDELSRIKVSDFEDSGDNESYVLTIIGKGDKEGLVYILKEEVEKELEYYRQNKLEHIAASSTSSKIMNGSQIYKFLNTQYKKAGINYTGVHILRHTFAKTLSAKKTNLVHLQQLLRHADVKTTMIYVNPSQKEVHKAYMEGMKKNKI